MANYRLSIITADGEAFNDRVESLIAPGELGAFGVLSDHAPLVALLRGGPLTVTQDGAKSYFAVSSGILEVNDQSNVLLLTDFAKKVKTIEEAKEKSVVNGEK